MPFAKGSQAAKDHMAKIRAMKKSGGGLRSGGGLFENVARQPAKKVKRGRIVTVTAPRGSLAGLGGRKKKAGGALKASGGRGKQLRVPTSALKAIPRAGGSIGIVARTDRFGVPINSGRLPGAIADRLKRGRRILPKPEPIDPDSAEGQAIRKKFEAAIKRQLAKGRGEVLGGGPQGKGGRFEIPAIRPHPVKAPPLIVKAKTKPKRRPKPRPRPPNPLKPRPGPFSDRGREREFPEAPVDHVTDGRVKKRKLVKVKLPLHKGAALGPVRRKPIGPKGRRPKKKDMRLKVIHGPPVTTTRGPVRGLVL
jgi:hypothetical protein